MTTRSFGQGLGSPPYALHRNGLADVALEILLSGSLLAAGYSVRWVAAAASILSLYQNDTFANSEKLYLKR